jgi:metal-responsive CopG/Arc/MetJ family transcriptional regulator
MGHTQISLRLSTKLLKAIDARAVEDGCTRGALLRRIILRYLNTRDDDDADMQSALAELLEPE